MKFEEPHATDRTIDAIYVFLGVCLVAMIALSTWRILSLVLQA
jgi:hypothetical protein